MTLTEQERHNAAIKESYRKLFEVFEDQISSTTQEENVATTYAPTAPVQTPSYESVTPTYTERSYEPTPVMEQTPQVKEYVPSPLAATLFTADRFEKFADYQEKQTAPVQEVAVAPQTVAKTVAVAQYSLTPMAKLAMVVFAIVTIAMLVFIGINSQTIANRNAQIATLEAEKQELVQVKGEIQERIRHLQTEESILERAKAAGLID